MNLLVFFPKLSNGNQPSSVTDCNALFNYVIVHSQDNAIDYIGDIYRSIIHTQRDAHSLIIKMY